MSSLDDSFDIEASYQREGEMEADDDPYKISYNEESNEKCLQKITEIEKTQNDHYKTAKCWNISICSLLVIILSILAAILAIMIKVYTPGNGSEVFLLPFYNNLLLCSRI